MKYPIELVGGPICGEQMQVHGNVHTINAIGPSFKEIHYYRTSNCTAREGRQIYVYERIEGIYTRWR